MMAHPEQQQHPVLDRVGDIWERTGGYVGERPLQVIGALVASIIVIIVLGLVVATTSNRADINDIRDALCGAPHETYSVARKAQCQRLLSNLLDNPTPAQRERLRIIVKGTP